MPPNPLHTHIRAEIDVNLISDSQKKKKKKKRERKKRGENKQTRRLKQLRRAVIIHLYNYAEHNNILMYHGGLTGVDVLWHRPGQGGISFDHCGVQTNKMV